MRKNNQSIKQQIEEIREPKKKTAEGINPKLLTSGDDGEQKPTLSYKVLIAEPSNLFSNVIDKMFAETVFKYSLVHDGEAALAQITAFNPDVILMATGSEVALAVNAATALTEQGKQVRVVSMPSTNIFDKQSNEYKEAILPLSVTKRVAIEAAHVDFWAKYVGLSGAVVGMTTFGESAPGNVLLEHFGFTVDNVVNTVNEL